MDSKHCTLCGLEISGTPVTGEDTDGVFCCSGCLHVHNLLQDMDPKQAKQLRRQTIEARKQERNDTTLPDAHEETFFKVDGMHCATCESFIETLATRKAGIYRCEASYASEMMKVYYDPNQASPENLPEELSKMGYRVRNIEAGESKATDTEVTRLVIGGFFGIIGLLLYSLFLYPSYLGEGLIDLTETEQLYFISNIFVMTSFVLFYTGYPILRGAWVSLSVLNPNMDLLISIAALSAYLYSFGALLAGSAEVYFDVTMAIILVVSLGNYYEKKIKAGRQDILSRLSEKRSSEAHVKRNGRLTEVAVSDIRPGELLVVKAGERIPVDGTVVEGKGVVNEALMTGESMPVSKSAGDEVISGTVLTQNALTIRAGEQVHSTIDELLRLMWNIQSARPGKQRLADRIAAYFVPGVLVLGIATFGYHLMVNGAGATNALLAALSVLIVSCPCALGLATPLAIASGIRAALDRDIVFKTAALFEQESETDIIALDKTGTLTSGRMRLLDTGINPQALKYAARLEQYASHPVAEAISIAVAPSATKEIADFRSFQEGITGKIEDKQIYVGKPEWIAGQGYSLSAELQARTTECRTNGTLPVAVAWDGAVQEILEVGDQLREQAAATVSRLKEEGKQIAVITGDTAEAAQHIERQLSPDFLFSEAHPESKANIIKELRSLGRVAMVGDGSNDAPALAEADLGIAFGDLTAIAAESAQVVIPSEQLNLIPSAFQAMQQTRSRIRQNLGWAFLYNAITVPLAIAGVINPLFAAVAMAASSLLVVTNSSRTMKITG